MRLAIGLASCVVSAPLAEPARADKAYAIYLNDGVPVLTAIGTQVVVTGLEEHRTQMWFVSRILDGDVRGRHITLQRDGKTWYLTANREGDVFLSEQPTDGSLWGIRLPTSKDDKPVNSWIGSGLRSPRAGGPRRLYVDKYGRERQRRQASRGHARPVGRSADQKSVRIQRHPIPSVTERAVTPE